ncbi:MAG: hypothetical protein M1827_006124 [Pycnora praestabilis]|nr:MAG: hypothetical protein M1827_006124 [Pycnora praestabilis]
MTENTHSSLTYNITTLKSEPQVTSDLDAGAMGMSNTDSSQLHPDSKEISEIEGQILSNELANMGMSEGTEAQATSVEKHTTASMLNCGEKDGEHHEITMTMDDEHEQDQTEPEIASNNTQQSQTEATENANPPKVKKSSKKETATLKSKKMRTRVTKKTAEAQ